MFDWQMVATLVVVAAAGIYLVRLNLRRWRSKSAGCAGSCCGGGASKQGSTPTNQLISPESLLARLEQKH